MAQADQWNPAQYNKFQDERLKPSYDLLDLVRPDEGMRVIDLGCGTGVQSAMLAERLPGAVVEGVDSSPAMLQQAASRASKQISFRQADISAMSGYDAYDLIYSNAVLQWVPDNEGLLDRMLGAMRPGTQIAVQVPKNEGHPSHRIAEDLARERPFRDLLGGYVRRTEALELERCSMLLYEHGFREQVCFEKIYGHELSRTTDVVEWVKGSMLSAYLTRLDPAAQESFVEAYRRRLLEELGDQRPFFYPFRRLLFWGSKQSPRP
ncbi:MAG: methyltransferase domain-containing protein [Dehalococcoidia bacterium]